MILYKKRLFILVPKWSEGKRNVSHCILQIMRDVLVMGAESGGGGTGEFENVGTPPCSCYGTD